MIKSTTETLNPTVVRGSKDGACAYFGDSVKECTCSPAMVTRYQKRISGPLLDRIDIHIEVPHVLLASWAAFCAPYHSWPRLRLLAESGIPDLKHVRTRPAPGPVVQSLELPSCSVRVILYVRA